MTVNNLNENLVWLLGQCHPINHQLQHTELPVLTCSPASDNGQQPPENMARLQIAPQSTTRPRLLAQEINNVGLPTPSPSRSPARTSVSRPNVSLPVTPLLEARARNRSPPLCASVQRIPDTDVIDIDDIDSDDFTNPVNENLNSPTLEDWVTPERLSDEDAADYVRTGSLKRGKKRKSQEHVFEPNKPRTRHCKKMRSEKGTSPQFNVEGLDDSRIQLDAHSDGVVQNKRDIVSKRERSGGSSCSEFHDFLAAEYVSTQPSLELKRETEDTSGDLFRVADEIVQDSDDAEDRVVSSQNKLALPKAVDRRTKALKPHVNQEHDQPQLPQKDSQSFPDSVALFLPTPSQDTSSQSRSTRLTPHIDAATLCLANRTIVRNFMKVDSRQMEDLVSRLEVSSKAANAEYTQYLCEEGQVSEKLKELKKLASERLKASRKVLEARQILSKTMSDRQEKKEELDRRLNAGEEEDSEDENNILCALGKAIVKLKPIVDKQEAELFHFLKLAGLSQPGSDTTSPVRPASSSARSTDGVLVASTQKPRTNTLGKSRTSPSLATDSPSQHVGQTPMPEMSYSFSVRSPRKVFPDPILEEDPSRLERSSRRTIQPSILSNAPYTANMGSPPFNKFEDAHFSDEEDDADMLNAANAFEQIFTGPDSNRRTLGEISHNLRRQKAVPTAALVTQPDAAQKRLPWTDDVFKALRKRFHLEGFRHNQLEAINATLAGDDAFVLMPTGGGKSLCYQLPSVVISGRTRGVTVVISPLLSLMQDQVDHLTRLKIQALLFNGEITPEHRRMVLQSLQGPDPERFAQLLYITPEMMSKSVTLLNALQMLHKHNKLARIVIDEAHCVSQWGHDFRPDYKELGKVRRQFFGVPVMALTATATENVKLDVMHNLEMDNSKVFTQSFNRPNLSYTVLKKDKTILTNMAERISRSYRNQSGIIYCLSRKNCEAVAKKLREEHGINAAHYHAGMDPADRIAVQKKWQSNEFHVIVATIAFGMGIDKPDVRFVIHHTIPKSLEGYYQETGRAGRDGRPSGCYLYYGFGDSTQLRRMIEEGEGGWEQKERQKMMLRNVIMFCENRSDCRRMQVLNYFNEHFSPGDCGDTCDNCTSNSTFEQRDLTEHARNAVAIVEQIGHSKITMGHCIDIYRGCGGKKMTDTGHDDLDQFGLGKDLEREDVDRLFYRLVFEDALEEYQYKNRMGFPTQYVKLGHRCREFLGGRATLTMQCRISPNSKPKAKAPAKATTKGKKKKPATGVAAAADEYPASTNVSSPLQGRTAPRLNRKRPAVNSDSESDEDFEPVRKAGVSKSRRTKAVGPPITMDQKLASLDEVHLHVLEDFVENGRKVVQKILIEQSLRKKTISDTMLRQMAVDFPSNKAAMLQIEGMNDDLFSYYGPVLISLVQDAHADYCAMLAAQGGEEHVGQGEHNTVVDISDDNDFIDDDDVGDTEADIDANESSRYFGEDDEVARFNRQISQMRTYAAPDASAGIATTKASEPYKLSADRGSFKNKSTTRGFSKANRSASGAVRRKKTSTGSRSRATQASSSRITSFPARQPDAGGSKGGGRKGGNRSAGGTSGARSIDMMPT